MNLGKVFKNGIIDENPTFVQVIGMCPTLAVTSAAINNELLIYILYKVFLINYMFCCGVVAVSNTR